MCEKPRGVLTFPNPTSPSPRSPGPAPRASRCRFWWCVSTQTICWHRGGCHRALAAAWRQHVAAQCVKGPLIPAVANSFWLAISRPSSSAARAAGTEVVLQPERHVSMSVFVRRPANSAGINPSWLRSTAELLPVLYHQPGKTETMLFIWIYYYILAHVGNIEEKQDWWCRNTKNY